MTCPPEPCRASSMLPPAVIRRQSSGSATPSMDHRPPRVSPRGELEDYADEVPALVGGAVTLGLLITFAIAAATLLITTVDAVGERRRSLAALAAAGASRGVLRRALVVETALPMLAGVALGIGSAIAGTWMVFEAVTAYEELTERPPIYWRSLGCRPDIRGRLDHRRDGRHVPLAGTRDPAGVAPHRVARSFDHRRTRC